LKIGVPPGTHFGHFCHPSNIKLELYSGHSLEDYEEMIQGIWAWSTNGVIHDRDIIFNNDYTCELRDRYGKTKYDASNCFWGINMRTQ
jgi:hypothetical protein